MQARYVNLKPPQDSFDLFCLLQGWRRIGYHPTNQSVVALCDIILNFEQFHLIFSIKL